MFSLKFAIPISRRLSWLVLSWWPFAGSLLVGTLALRPARGTSRSALLAGFRSGGSLQAICFGERLRTFLVPPKGQDQAVCIGVPRCSVLYVTPQPSPQLAFDALGAAGSERGAAVTLSLESFLLTYFFPFYIFLFLA